MPEVSVCIPTRNMARYLAEAVESVLRQEFADFELIVVDNASTDATPALCRRLQRDERLRYVRYEALVNQAGNFNRCLKEAEGELVTLLHADDLLHPGFLEARVATFAERPAVDFCFGAVQVIDDHGAAGSINSAWPEDRRFGPGELLGALLQACLVAPPSLMVRKRLIDRVGWFRTDLTWGHDWEWTLRLAEQGGGCFDSRPLASYRVHDASGTAETLNAARNGAQERRILRETCARLSASHPHNRRLRRPAFRALARRQMYFAEQALLNDRGAVARNNLGYAARADPWMLTRPTFWALGLSSLTSVDWYQRYQRLRHPARVARSES